MAIEDNLDELYGRFIGTRLWPRGMWGPPCFAMSEGISPQNFLAKHEKMCIESVDVHNLPGNPRAAREGRYRFGF
jgi:hypothetical protein